MTDDDVPPEVVDALNGATDATLQAVIEYCENELTPEDPTPEEPDQDEREPPEEFEGDADQWVDAVEGTEAPSRATLTEKEIKGNIYLYWQWSQDGATKSEYIAPKNPKRSGSSED